MSDYYEILAAIEKDPTAVRQFRDRLGLTQSEVANGVEIHLSTVQFHENGRSRKLSKRVAKDYAKFFSRRLTQPRKTGI